MIYLINPPHVAIEHPSLALGQFKSLLLQAGKPCKVLDLNLLMAKVMGYDLHLQSWCGTDGQPERTAACWSAHVWDRSYPGDVLPALASLTQDGAGFNAAAAEMVAKVCQKRIIPAFMGAALEIMADLDSPLAVGITCTMVQVMPALALGRLLKIVYPGVRLVYGGPSFWEQMGAEYIRAIPWIDAVSTGEADDVVVELFDALCAGRSPSGLQGVLYRRPDNTIGSGPEARAVSQEFFESMPDPDFDDYFDLAWRLGMNNDPEWQGSTMIMFEGTRGCWWGKKRQCSFCGRNDGHLPLRKKSARRIGQMLAALADRYPGQGLRAAEDAIGSQYFDGLLPALAANPPDARMEVLCSIRADSISRERMQLLCKAGFTYLSPGLETLSSHILRLMRKGMRALQNIYFLKLCRQYGVKVLWNYLVRVPGERPEDYSTVAALIPKLVHLAPPHIRPLAVMLYRFSPYFLENKQVRNVRVRALDRFIYPCERIDPMKVAYWLEADWLDVLDPQDYQGLFDQLARWMWIWNHESIRPKLSMRKNLADGTCTIEDTRRTQQPCTWTLDAEQTAVYELTADPSTTTSIVAQLSAAGRIGLTEEKVRAMLDDFMARGLLIREGGTCLGLALPHHVWESPADQGTARQVGH